MIFDTFTNYAQYLGLNKNLDQGLKLISEMTADGFEDKQIPVDGKNLFINRALYETKDLSTAVMESHGSYIDIMTVLEGEETVYVYPEERFSHVYQPYDENTDVLLADFEKQAVPVRLTPGTFLVLFPGDGHSPACMTETKMIVKKIIGKALVKEAR